jgi:NTE family protein
MIKRNIDTLLICGGGFKFFYLYGAIKYLYDINVLQNIKEYIGISAGALVCTLFNVGYTPQELNNFILEFNFEKLLNPHIDCLLENKGLDDGEFKKVAIQQFLTNKNIDPDITFKKLFELTNKKISFIGANLTLHKLEIINYETYPDMEIWKGLLITSALPILYQPIIHNDQYIVDGGVFDNYPIELFINKNNNILGINLIFNVTFNDMNLDFLNYMSNLLLSAHHWKNNNKTNNYKEYTISINVSNALELINPDISIEERIVRIKHGYESAKNHFIENEFIKTPIISEEEQKEEEDQDEEEEQEEEEQEKEQEEEKEENINKKEEKLENYNMDNFLAINHGIDYII